MRRKAQSQEQVDTPPYGRVLRLRHECVSTLTVRFKACCAFQLSNSFLAFPLKAGAETKRSAGPAGCPWITHSGTMAKSQVHRSRATSRFKSSESGIHFHAHNLCIVSGGMARHCQASLYLPAERNTADIAQQGCKPHSYIRMPRPKVCLLSGSRYKPPLARLAGVG